MEKEWPWNSRTRKRKRKSKEAYHCKNCGGLLSYIVLPKLERCQHCGHPTDWPKVEAKADKPKKKARQKTLGQRVLIDTYVIEDLMQTKYKSQADCARQIGMANQTLSKAMTWGVCSIKFAERIAEAVDKPVQDILFGGGSAEFMPD